MRWFKLIIGSLILLLIALFIYQNLETFNRLEDFRLYLGIREEVKWSLSLYSLLITAGMLGFLLGFILMLKPYFKTKRLLAQERQAKQQLKPQEAAPVSKEALQAS